MHLCSIIALRGKRKLNRFNAVPFQETSRSVTLLEKQDAENAGIPAAAEKRALLLFGDLQGVAAHFPLDANEEIEVHGFGLEPAFERLAGIGAEFDEHFSFEHVDEDALGAGGAAGLHALGKRFRTLAGEASEGVLGEVAWHRNSCIRIGV
jgi:hypothetical protein